MTEDARPEPTPTATPKKARLGLSGTTLGWAAGRGGMMPGVVAI